MRRLLLMTIAAACAALAVPSAASAAACAYTNPSAGSWHVAGNWDCGVIPGGGDTVTIGGGDDVVVDQAESAMSVALEGGSLTVGFAATLTIGGSYTQAGVGTLKIQIAGTAPGTTFGRVAAVGAATVGGTLTVIQVGGFDPVVTDSFPFLTSGSTTGAFATLDAAPLLLGKRYRLEYPAGPGFGASLAVDQIPQNNTPPSADGATTPGSQLSCSTGAWLGDPPPSFGIQWLRDGAAIDGATQTTYALADPDAQHALACRVTATNIAGGTFATSAARDIAAIAPQNAGQPGVSGSGQPGSSFSCATGSWSGFPAPALSVQWLRDGSIIGGAEGADYAVTQADAGRSIACRVTATNAAGAVAATSNALGVAGTFGPPADPERDLADLPRTEVGGKIGLPPTRACLKERYLRVRVRQPAGVKINAVAVLANGKKNKSNKVAGRFNTTFDLRAIKGKSLTARITITTAGGRKIVAERRYRVCLPPRKPAPRKKR